MVGGDEMTHIYRTSELALRRFSSGMKNFIELDDFQKDFGVWCEFQKLHIANLNDMYVVWKALFKHLEGAPLQGLWRFQVVKCTRYWNVRGMHIRVIL